VRDERLVVAMGARDVVLVGELGCALGIASSDRDDFRLRNVARGRNDGCGREARRAEDADPDAVHRRAGYRRVRCRPRRRPRPVLASQKYRNGGISDAKTEGQMRPSCGCASATTNVTTMAIQ